MPKTNPNGANQYLYDPRQKLCWEYYVDPRSETFGVARRSAMKAGYTVGTANQITTEQWFIEKLRRLSMLSKAEKVLEETLVMDVKVPIIVDGETVGEKIDPALAKIKQDTAKFVASTQGKDQGYSTRSEITGINGGSVFDGLRDALVSLANDKEPTKNTEVSGVTIQGPDRETDIVDSEPVRNIRADIQKALQESES